MSDYGFFWNSRDGDRKYNADDFATWLRKFFTTGVFNGELFVSAAGGMNVSIGSGYANIQGKVMFFEEPQSFTLDVAHSTLQRIDNIVVEMDVTDRMITTKVIKGTPGSQATPPVRSESTYQIIVARITIPASATAITQANILDTRMDADLCGYVTGTVEEIDFSQIVEQWETYYEEFKSGELNDFETWSDSMQSSYSIWTEAQKAAWLTWIGEQEQSYSTWDAAQRQRFSDLYDDLVDLIDGAAAGKLEAQIHTLDDKVDGLRFVTTLTIEAEGWNGKQYDLTGVYPDSDYDIEVFPFSSMTENQMSAWLGAEVVSNYTTNILIARGTVPLIDIPVMVMCFKKTN